MPKLKLYRVESRTTGRWRVCLGLNTFDYARGYVCGRQSADSCPSLRIVDEDGTVIEKWRGHEQIP